LAFLGDFGKFFGLGSSKEVLGDAGAATATFFGLPPEAGRQVGRTVARATDNLSGDGNVSPLSTADQALEQSAVPVSQIGSARPSETANIGLTGMQTTQAGFGNLLPLLSQAGRFLTSTPGQIATGVGTGVAFGQGFNSMTGTKRTTVLTQSRRNKAKVRQLVNFMGIEGTADFLSQSMNVNVTPNDVVNLLLRTFRNDGAYITKAQVRNLRRTTNRFKSLEKQVKEATSMSRTTRRAPVRRTASTTLIKN
jgi:hypothetical protein